MTWCSVAGGEYRFSLGDAGDVVLIHDVESRAHLRLVPTFWRTDSGEWDAEDRSAVLAASLDIAKAAALVKAREVLREALAKVELELATPERRERRLKKPSLEPIYDDVYRAGAEQIDALAGAPTGGHAGKAVKR